MNERSPQTWSPVVPALALMVLAVVVFARTGWNQWTGWDDTAYIINNPHMTVDGGFARIWTTNESEQFYPLTFSSYWLQHRCFGEAPAGYHLVNTLLHAVNAALALLVFRAIGFSRFVAVTAAAMFAVHPTQVMSVAWIAEHKNVLAALFTLPAMFAWIRSRTGSGSTLWYLASLVLFALGMLSKTAVLGLPLALLALDHFVLQVPWRAGVLRSLPMLAIAVVLSLVTLAFEQKFVDKSSPEWMPDLLSRVLISGAAPWVYLWHLLWPWTLSPVYDLGEIRGVLWWLAIAASAAVGFAATARASKGPLAGLTAWGLWHFILLLGPTLGLIPFGNLAVTPVSDHFLYLASLGLFVPFAAAVERISVGSESRRRLAMIAVGSVLLVCAVLSWRDVAVYRDATSMWSRGAKVAPGNYTARLGLAEGLAAAGNRPDAVVQYRQATSIRPEWPDAWLLQGQAELAAGDMPAAERSLTKALELAPAMAPAMTDLADVYERTRRLEQAMQLYERSVATDASNVKARLGLAKMYLGFARYEDALSQFGEIVRLRSDLGMGHLGVATCERALGRDDRAVATLRAGLTATHDDPALCNMLARILATSRADAVRNGPEAAALAERVNSQAGWQNPLLLDTFAAAMAELGRSDQAADASQKAAELHARMGNSRGADRSRELAESYRRGEKLRE